MEHFGDEWGVMLRYNVALELESIRHLIADIEGFWKQSETGDALKGLKSRAVVDEIADIVFE